MSVQRGAPVGRRDTGYCGWPDRRMDGQMDEGFAVSSSAQPCQPCRGGHPDRPQGHLDIQGLLCDPAGDPGITLWSLRKVRSLQRRPSLLLPSSGSLSMEGFWLFGDSRSVAPNHRRSAGQVWDSVVLLEPVASSEPLRGRSPNLLPARACSLGFRGVPSAQALRRVPACGRPAGPPPMTGKQSAGRSGRSGLACCPRSVCRVAQARRADGGRRGGPGRDPRSMLSPLWYNTNTRENNSFIFSRIAHKAPNYPCTFMCCG